MAVRHHSATVDGPGAVAGFGQPFAPHHGERVRKKSGEVQPQGQQAKGEKIHGTTQFLSVASVVEPLMLARFSAVTGGSDDENDGADSGSRTHDIRLETSDDNHFTISARW